MSRFSDTIDNPKHHFIVNDGFKNISYDVSYSVFNKYTCMAGCEICYLRKDWIRGEAFKKYIPIVPNDFGYIAKLMDFFSYFKVANTIDDLRLLKDSYPELFRFYQEYGNAFYICSITDNALMRHLPIIKNGEVRAKGVREISLSELFLSKINPAKLLSALSAILEKTPILKIKAILAQSSNSAYSASELLAWCAANGVPIEKQFEFNADKKLSNSTLTELANARGDASFLESSTYSEFGTHIFPVQSEVLFLMHDSFYSELKSATTVTASARFATLNDFSDPVNFLKGILRSKLVDYARYTEAIVDKNNHYYAYFKWVVDNVLINEDFTFIPKVFFMPYSEYYTKLVADGVMLDTQYGLIRPGAKQVVPIFTFKNT